jgi:peptidoglycan/xylan/chitin deacetylase (PgdA/CDA1 family)
VTLPSTYTELKPFEPLFATGVPILTYHKLGPRPGNARLRGMYLGERLFRRQLNELKAAGFSSAFPDEVCTSGALGNPHRRVTLSFDDGYVNVLRHGIAALGKYGFKAVQFVVADQIGGFNVWDSMSGEAREPLMSFDNLRAWLAAGHRIGSHTLSHARLTEVPAQQAREEIFASKKMLEDLFGVPITDFCYPYGDWNPRLRDWVQEAGYKSACSNEFGVNGPGQDPFVLRRIQTRYRSWGLKGLRERARLLRS